MRTWQPRTWLAIGFIAFVLYAFPGYMSSDSVNQLLEARSGQLTAAHPPIMAAIWAGLDAVVSGPLLMLLLQGGVMLAGLYVVFGRVVAPRPAAILASAVLVFPPVLTPMAVIWKDSQMAAFLVAGVAAITSPRRRVRFAGVALLGLACAYRYNAAAAVVPLIGLLFEATPGRRWLARYAIAAGAALVAVGAALAVDRALIVAPTNVSFSESIAMFDIAGVIRFTRPRSDADLRQVLAGAPLHVDHDIQAKVRRRYKPRNAWFLTASDDPVFDPPTSDAERAALDRARSELIRDDPGAYLHHRWDVYRELLGLSRQPLWSPVFNFFVEYPPQVELVHHTGDPSVIQRVAYRVLFALADTPVYWAWLYGALAIVLLVGAARDRTSVALLLSGVLYELGYFPTAATPDFRYSHWMITATVIAAILIICRRRAARARPAPGAGGTPAASPRGERAPPDRG